MFESDDYDQILSQLDLPDPCNTNNIRENQQEPLPSVSKCSNDNIENSMKNKHFSESSCKENICLSENICKNNVIDTTVLTHNIKTTADIHETHSPLSPKHTKRKLINSYFDHKSKRKFPGPAGLLNGTFEESNDDDICRVELLSQDVDYSQLHLYKGIFESPLWARLLQDAKDLRKVDTIKGIKQQAHISKSRHHKAETITGYVESVDRSVIDPLIILRDTTESIQCTLHRDAWIAFSPYIVSEYCALVLCNATVLTTGSAFKKHYLNITLGNIKTLYSSAIIKQEDESFPTGFNKIYEEDYTIILNEKKNTGLNLPADLLGDSNILDGLDGAFSDDVF